MDFSITTSLLWFLIGLLTAIAVHLLDPFKTEEVFYSLAAGIIGALVGGVMTGVFFGVDGGMFLAQSSIFATAGAVAFVFWQRTLLKSTPK